MPRLSAESLYQSWLVRPFHPALRQLKRSQFGSRVAASPWFPPNWRSTINLFRILALEYGHVKTAATGKSTDAAGRAIPWYTYPAIEFLRQRDFSQASVFEYGCGNSTLFWSSIAREVVAVEDDESWHAQMSARVPSNCRLLFQPDLERFVATIDDFGKFDVIIVDGPARGRTRFKCAQAALRHLDEGGMIIVDNSEWLHQSTALLRNAGLLQVDMTGFSPINDYTGSTSFFFDRRWQVPPNGDRLPAPGIGGRPYDWEPTASPEGRVVQCGQDVLGGVAVETPMQLDMNGERRTFRVVGYAMGAGNIAIAILDDGQQRVLLTHHHQHPGPWPGEARVMEQEIERIRGMSPAAFTEFVNTHPGRRYKL